MANLLSNQTGLETLNRITCFLGRKRMSRNLVRSFYIAFHNWQQTGYFDKSTLLNQLNELTQDEIVDLNTMLGELGCLENATQQNMTIYVDSVNGSDVTGDGSVTHPYASFAFLDIFPRYINNNVRIMLLEDVDMLTDPLNLNFIMGQNGCFSIIGRSAPTLVTTSAGAGPFVCNGAINHGSPPTGDYCHFMQFPVTWGVDELYGKWIRFETGTNAGEVYQIHGNTSGASSYIFFRGGLEAQPLNGDEVTIIEPTVTLSCQRLNIEMTGPEDVYDTTLEASRFNLLNLNLDLRATPSFTETNNFVLKSTIESQISFVTIITDNSQPNSVILKSNLNQYKSVDVDIGLYTLTSIDNIDGPAASGSPCGILMYNSDFLPPNFTFNSLVIRGAKVIRCVTTRGLFYIEKSSVTIELCCAGLVHSQDNPSCNFNRNMVDADTSNHSISLYYCGLWRVNNLAFVNLANQGLNIFHLQTATLYLEANIDLAGLTFTGVGFDYSFLGISKVITATSPALLTGANDIRFPGGVGITAFPAADRQVPAPTGAATDLLENSFTWLATP